MTEQYWVGNFYIDISRNQITHNEQSQTLAPKALAVLSHLAENKGKVVSYDELLSSVWQDTVVSPNTLQRSIAQLRKALGDDGKVQVYIKTHAKQGYSLESDVRWHDYIDVSSLDSQNTNTAQQAEVDQTQVNRINRATKAAGHSKLSLRVISIIIGVAMLGFIGSQALDQEHSSKITFDKLRSLTATDDKEFDATYSPDGKYIVFHRYLDKLCVNKVWAKNIRTQKETLLTEDWGAYGSHSFSKDGKKLVFLATEACNQPVAQKSCYNLVSLDFETALKSPQKPSIMMQCKNSIVKNPTWLSNNNIALLQKESKRWKLINYSASENKSTDLYVLSEGDLIDFAYSTRDNLIAVISSHSDGQHYIDMLKPDGQIISSNLLERPPEIPQFRRIFPSFDPLKKQLVFSTGRQFFTLSYDGKINKVSFPFADRMVQPEFHPEGKKILFIKGPYDSDVVLLPLDQLTKVNSEILPSDTQSKQPTNDSRFERSNVGEDHATFQPNGELIAFWSERSGEEQLWISDGHTPRQLSKFPTDTYIRGIDWADDGNSLLVNANNVLTQIDLDSNQRRFPMKYPVHILYQWDSKNNNALLLTSIKGVLTLVEYNLNNSEVKELSDKRIVWALRSEDGQLIYKDHLGQFWQPGAAEHQHIKALENQGGKTKIFLIENNVMFGINSKNKLWSYELNNSEFKILGELGTNVDYLSDINQEQLLMTIQVSEKKEVAELTISQ